MGIVVRYHRDKDVWTASDTDPPHVYGVGKSQAEALVDLNGALQFAGIRKTGDEAWIHEHNSWTDVSGRA